MFTSVILVVLMFLQSSAASQQTQQQVQGQGEAASSGEPLDAVDAWMRCTECTQDDLMRVAQLGSTGVSVLGTFLRTGPSVKDQRAMEVSLREQYRGLKEFEKRHPKNKVSFNEQQFVKTYLANFDAQYRKRAAAALAEIGGPDARAILQEAMGKQHRQDVKVVLQHAWERVNRTPSQ